MRNRRGSVVVVVEEKEKWSHLLTLHQRSSANPELRVLHFDTAPHVLSTSSSSKVYRSYRPSESYACQCLSRFDSVLAAEGLQWRRGTAPSHSQLNTIPIHLFFLPASSIIRPAAIMRVLTAALSLASVANAAALHGSREASHSTQIMARQSSSTSRYPAHTIEQPVRIGIWCL